MRKLTHRVVAARVAVVLVAITAIFAAAPAASAQSAATQPAASTSTPNRSTTDEMTVQAWECEYGYTCLYPLPGGDGNPVQFSCGTWDLRGYPYSFASLRTTSASTTVWNIRDDETWENYGSILPHQRWSYVQNDVIDAITVGC